MTANTVRAPGRAAFAFVFITVLLDMLALGVMVPVLPKLLLEFLGGDMGRAATLTGMFGFSWAAMQFVFSPILGALSDRFGRRPVIILSNLGLGLDYVLMALAPGVGWLFAGRLISGISAATVSTASAYIADVTPPDKRAAKFGMIGAAFGFGFIVGPAVGGLLGSMDLRLPFWVSAGLSLANACYGFFVLPESLPPERRARFEWRKANPVGSLAFLRAHPVLLGLAAAGFLSRFAHDVLPSTFVLYTDYRYGWSESTVGLALAATGVMSMLVSGALVRPAIARLGERRALFTGLAFGSMGFLIYGLAPTGVLFIAGLPFVALWGLYQPAMQGLMTRRVEASAQGQLQGAQSSLMGFSGMIAPLVFTQTFATTIGPGALHLPGAVFLLAATLLVGSLLLARRATRTDMTPAPAVARDVS
jgi:MFS transporter, DHA1 family, tetracycline resistance protein